MGFLLSLLENGLVAGFFAFLWWRAARMEENTSLPIFWSLASIVVSAFAWLILGFDWPGKILCQLAMGLTIGIVRTIIYMRSTRQ